ncbi:hypothetical protein HNV08_01890 [Winogradskyella eckloniae]|uniref:DUF6090 family protein n=1 Tax=Winogradskyella eckloniae TaxID=1089306 RepID=UPI001563A305|nr:DUF6090 family protein [Winogradskyella eckloniae]NRD18784.1 hypothetical protein [Winogradskyella eckloniae]
MITLLRRFRQRLLSENKFSKYLIYAIGEIILVVIGILIALGINNNNNFNAQRKIEHDYLTSLQTEFKTNLKKINTSISVNEQRVQSLKTILTLFNKNVSDTTSTHTISQLLGPIFGSDIQYTPATGVLNDIISSGKLNLILNKNLRQDLASFESTINYLSTQLNDADFTQRKLTSLFFKNGSAKTIVTDLKIIDSQFQSISAKTNNKDIFNSIEFENYLVDYYLLAKATNGPRLFGGIKTQIETILKEIDHELEHK